jgi:hypothetical protein
MFPFGSKTVRHSEARGSSSEAETDPYGRTMAKPQIRGPTKSIR